jgi:G2/mitotic-specific cyclin 1/2
MPNPNYMESQKELAWKMRGILTDWLIQVHVRFRLLPETLFLCVNIIDRFLSARVVSLAKLQLVGVTCMFIAAKFEEICSPSVTHFLMCADSTYTESEILQAERYVLKTLDWNLSYPNPVHYLRRVSKADEYNVQVRTLAKYLLEIGCLEWRLIAAPPSLLAAAAIWLARFALGMEVWVGHLLPKPSPRTKFVCVDAQFGPLLFVFRECLGAHSEFNVELHSQAYSPRVVP